jgi:hypothetical protein
LRRERVIGRDSAPPADDHGSIRVHLESHFCSPFSTIGRIKPPEVGMGKKLSASKAARYGRDGLLYPVDAFTRAEPRRYRNCLERRDMRARFQLGVIGLLLSLTLAGCADSAAGSDNDKRGVFYGGVTGSHSWP